MLSVLQFKRIFKTCPLCNSLITSNLEKKPAFFGCFNEDCKRFGLTVANLAPGITETLLEIQLGNVRYRYCFTQEILAYYLEDAPTDGKVTALKEDKMIEYFSFPEILYEKYQLPDQFWRSSDIRRSTIGYFSSLIRGNIDNLIENWEI